MTYVPRNTPLPAKSRTTNLGPFGELIRATGPMAKLNPFRFSTKYQDDETDLVYYGVRYLKTSTGGWLSRDPIGERGGANLYGFVDNNPGNRFDAFGLSALPVPMPPEPPIVLLPPPNAPPPSNVIPFRPPTPILPPMGPPQVAACVVVAVGGWYMGSAIDEATGISDGVGDLVGGLIAPSSGGGATGTWPGSPLSVDKDPLSLTKTNPGKCSCGRGCNPCPPNSPAWEVLIPRHGGTMSHWHWIEYHQSPPDHPKHPCRCNPIRQSSDTKPPGA